MYPYNYPWQGMYPYNPMVYGNYPIPNDYSNYPMMHRFDDTNDVEELSNPLENNEIPEESRGEGTGGMQIPSQFGKGHATHFPPGMPMQPGMMPMQPGMMSPEMMAQPGMQQDTFSVVLKQIQAETPQILSAIIALGMSIETLRQIVLRIVEAASTAQK